MWWKYVLAFLSLIAFFDFRFSQVSEYLPRIFLALNPQSVNRFRAFHRQAAFANTLMGFSKTAPNASGFSIGLQK